MSNDTPEDRLTLLEQSQLLHASTLRRHGVMLDKHEERMAALAANLTALRHLAERQQQTQQDLAATQAQLAETLDAIKDMLGRGNGH
jgi:hypothetical protein